MLKTALFLAASMNVAMPIADPGVRTTPLPDGAYTEIKTGQQATVYANADATYTVEQANGSTTVTLYPLPCFYVGATFLWKEVPDANGVPLLPSTYGVITIQGQGDSFSLEVVGDKKTDVAFQPLTTNEADFGNEFCSRLGGMHHMKGSKVLKFRQN